MKAVDGVDLDIGKGEVLGLVGESGCGKSVTALSIMYLLPQPPARIAEGQIWFHGLNLLAGSEDDTELRHKRRGGMRLVPMDRMIHQHRARMNKVRGRDMSMIFQEPMSSLNPVLPIGYQVAEVLIYQRRREICDGLLTKGALTHEDLDVFRRAVNTADENERDQLVADFAIRASLPAERVSAAIEASGLSIEQRVGRVERLARRRRLGSHWFLNFLKDYDDAEEQHFAREWEQLTRRYTGTAARDLFDPTINPTARGLPRLARITPGAAGVHLYFRGPGASAAADSKPSYLAPTEGLRQQVEALLEDARGRSEGTMFGRVDKVVLETDSLLLRFAEEKKAGLQKEAEYRSRQFVYRLLMLIPVLRTSLVRPIEEEAQRKALELLKLVRIPEATKVYREYPHELSGGMQQRVMIAMALACDPSLIIADEPTTALDVTTQAQILHLIKDLRIRVNSAILYITHDLAVIAELCDRVAVMYAGKVVEDAPVGELFEKPLHPYTQGLLESIVSMDSRRVDPGAPLPTIPGVVPDLLEPPKACRFHPRCKFAFDRCRVEEPRLREISPHRKVACHLYDVEEHRGPG